MAFFLQPAHFSFLILGKDLRHNPADAQLSLNRLCGPFVVAGKHNHGKPHLFHLADRLRAGFFYLVSRGHKPQETTVRRDIERCLSLFCQ